MSNQNIERQLDLIIALLETMPSEMMLLLDQREKVKKLLEEKKEVKK